jgi:hypothetical protein
MNIIVSITNTSEQEEREEKEESDAGTVYTPITYSSEELRVSPHGEVKDLNRI